MEVFNSEASKKNNNNNNKKPKSPIGAKNGTPLIIQ